MLAYIQFKAFDVGNLGIFIWYILPMSSLKYALQPLLMDALKLYLCNAMSSLKQMLYCITQPNRRKQC